MEFFSHQESGRHVVPERIHFCIFRITKSGDYVHVHAGGGGGWWKLSHISKGANLNKDKSKIREPKRWTVAFGTAILIWTNHIQSFFLKLDNLQDASPENDAHKNSPFVSDFLFPADAIADRGETTWGRDTWGRIERPPTLFVQQKSELR